MGFENQGGLENNMINKREGERIVKSQRPDDMDLRVKIQEERDFMISKALGEGRGSEVFEISRLPDEHFIKMIEERKKH